jgi:hypothetical protein
VPAISVLILELKESLCGILAGLAATRTQGLEIKRLSAVFATI